MTLNHPNKLKYEKFSVEKNVTLKEQIMMPWRIMLQIKNAERNSAKNLKINFLSNYDLIKLTIFGKQMAIILPKTSNFIDCMMP